MFAFRLNIKSPFGADDFDTLWCVNRRLTHNKMFEFQISKDSYPLIDIDLSWTTHQDHAGVTISIGILGYFVSMMIYDIRHWDHDNNRWATNE